jgi:MYXO-CTERM domain-containing protein
MYSAIEQFVRAEHLDFDMASVPEPAAVGLIVALLPFSRRRRRERRRRHRRG